MAPVISAKNVWKLLGPSPESYLRTMPADRSFDDIRADAAYRANLVAVMAKRAIAAMA